MIYFLIPSYNDSQNFELLLSRIFKSVKSEKKIIIVDDGSTDQTKAIIKRLSKKYPVLRIGYEKNKGPGYAFKYGFNYLIPKLKSNDSVVTLEADNSSDYKILRNMILRLKNYDVILSSPFADGGFFLGISHSRKILSTISNFLDKFIFRVKNVRTYSSFYRVYRGSILKKFKILYKDNFITEDGFSAVVEIVIKLNKINAKLAEVPAIVDWRNRHGKSKMKVGKTIINHVHLYKNYLLGKYNL